MSPLARLKPAWPAGLHVLAAAVYFALSRLVVATLSYSPIVVYGLPSRARFEGYARWDAAWYFLIAERGYYYDPGRQSAVAFFPAYPAVVRVVGTVLGDLMVAGVLVTIVAGAAALVLIRLWTSAMSGARVATLTVILVVTAPYAYYLFGALYSDALFVATAVAAFLLLERRHPWLAAIAGAVATAERPIGIAVTVGLLVRSLELDRVLLTRWSAAGSRPKLLRFDLSRLRVRTLAPLASVGGLIAYCALLWVRFDEPLAFMKAASAEGWSRDLSLRTLAKAEFVDLLASGDLTHRLVTVSLSAVLTIVALALLPAVLRTFGAGYFVYCLVVVLLPALTSPDFFGMGRYLLAPFPVYAAAAVYLDRRRFLAFAIPAASAAALIALSVFFIRGYYLA